MKIAVTSIGVDLDSQIDPRFGRCPFFVFVETDDMSFEVLENPNASLGGGAGIQSAQLVAGKGVKAVLTGNCGPNAYQTLSAAGIQVIVGISGIVREAVEQFKSGAFMPSEEPNVQSHFGMGAGVGTSGPGQGQGMGMGGGGMGRGMGGGGMGRGMGMGKGMGMGGGKDPYGGQGPTQMSRDQELSMLKDQAGTIKEQLNQIMGRIEELDKDKG